MRRTIVLVTAAAIAMAPAQLGVSAAADEPKQPAQHGQAKHPSSVVFTSNRDGDSELFVRSRNGRVAQLTQNAVDDYDAVWSPNGKEIAFVSTRDGDPEIYVVDADGADVRQLTHNSRTQSGQTITEGEPAWSPDGKRIAFTSNRDGGETEIYVMDRDGDEVERLTRTESYVMDNGPDWSPDGKEIAFSSSRVDYHNIEIYRMRADGTGVRRVTRTANGIDDNAPAWSPDGKELAFTSTRAGTHDIYVMRPDGSRVRRVTGAADLDDVFPRWTSNGKHLVFWTFSGPTGIPSADVWSVAADGSDRTRIVDSSASDSAPDPRPSRGR